jgi:hypothetical protein
VTGFIINRKRDDDAETPIQGRQMTFFLFFCLDDDFSLRFYTNKHERRRVQPATLNKQLQALSHAANSRHRADLFAPRFSVHFLENVLAGAAARLL